MASHKVANLTLDDAPRTASSIGAYRFAALVFTFTSGALAMFAFQQLRTPGHSSVPSPPSSGQVQLSDQLAATGVVKFAEVSAAEEPPNADNPQAASGADLPTVPSRLCVPGVTEPSPGRFVSLPLATSQPVAFVDVKPGDRVQKGWQVFSHWESPERLLAVKGELERAKKMFEIAQVRLAAAEQTLARLEKISSSVTPQELQDSQTTTSIRMAEVEAADLAVAEAKNRFTAMDFEFKQAFVTSPIEGAVASVDVVQGERKQFGNAFRGVTVLDPRVLVCRCLLSAEQATLLKRLAQSGDSIATIEFDSHDWPAKLLSIGVMADGSSGRIPVLLEIQNPEQILFSGIPVKVCFSQPFEALP